MTMYDYILEEKNVLSKILEEFKNIDIRNKKNILIIATGSSKNAALATKYFMQNTLDAIITIVEPFNYVHYSKIDKKIDLVILITQSGKSASIVEAYEYIKANTNVEILTITSNNNCKLAKESEYFLNLNMGEETVGFVTKGFSSTVLNLYLLAIENSNNVDKIAYKKELSDIINDLPNAIQIANSLCDKEKEKLKKCSRFSCIAYGDLYGISKEFETKFTETVRVPSIGYELEQYMHGPYLEANKNHILLFLSIKDSNETRSKMLKEYMEKYVMKTFSFEKNTVFVSIYMATIIQVLSYRISQLKSIDLGKRIFDDFDRVLKSKI
ncbi:SIS domain-containing protein [uncultured Sneathia sp.]|uniref:SIS domain-containing protein n=1 Tax=uncultured Sneathia sp. TaxID=278067 RepID=UPI00259B8712|nr:SIS domain-containing protein [uncultured Sneathia sp.]